MNLTAGFYRAAYRLGFHPWEEAAEHQPILSSTQEMIAGDEAGRGPPYGKALDLGCGSGFWSVELAERGWQVTGVDIVERALNRAEARVDEAGVDVRLLRADLTELASAGVGDGFRLLFDFGTLHGLSPAGSRARRARSTRSRPLMRRCCSWPGPRGPAGRCPEAWIRRRSGQRFRGGPSPQEHRPTAIHRS